MLNDMSDVGEYVFSDQSQSFSRDFDSSSLSGESRAKKYADYIETQDEIEKRLKMLEVVDVDLDNVTSKSVPNSLQTESKIESTEEVDTRNENEVVEWTAMIGTTFDSSSTNQDTSQEEEIAGVALIGQMKSSPTLMETLSSQTFDSETTSSRSAFDGEKKNESWSSKNTLQIQEQDVGIHSTSNDETDDLENSSEAKKIFEVNSKKLT